MQMILKTVHSNIKGGSKAKKKHMQFWFRKVVLKLATVQRNTYGSLGTEHKKLKVQLKDTHR